MEVQGLSSPCNRVCPIPVDYVLISNTICVWSEEWFCLEPSACGIRHGTNTNNTATEQSDQNFPIKVSGSKCTRESPEALTCAGRNFFRADERALNFTLQSLAAIHQWQHGTNAAVVRKNVTAIIAS